MIISLTVILCMLLFNLLVSIVYFFKKRINTIENKIYKKLLLGSFAGLIIELLCFFSIKNINLFSYGEIVAKIINKIFIVYLLNWELLFTEYIMYVSFEKSDNVVKLVSRIYNYNALIMSIMSLIILFMPIELYNSSEYIYSYGISTDMIMILGLVCIAIDIYSFVKNIKKISKKKFLPMLVLIVFMIFAAGIRKFNPGITLVNSSFAFVTILMYFTIENPDVSMLNELYKNKELMEQNYEDKYNFLFEMTQEARNPLVNINSLSTALRNEDNPDKLKEGLLTLNNMVRQLDFSINNILNISSLDVQKLKIINSTYELDKLCNEIATRIKPEIKKDVHFELSLPKQVPTLYGDYMKLRQILYSLLINSCKNTESGNIYLKVNVIEKYDICRVVFNISDTGSGMPIEKINEIISATGELDKDELENLEKREFNVKVCQKVMKIMGGNLMIKSNVGEGTDIVLTIDQRVHHEKENSILTAYENDIANYRKVLIVCQDKNIINSIKRKLNANNITSSVLYYGMDAVDKIKSGKNFDFILMEDEMKEMTGFMTFKEMQKVKGFKTPVIVMLKKDKENIKEHFIEDGFKDYLLTDTIDSELDRIIEKY